MTGQVGPAVPLDPELAAALERVLPLVPRFTALADLATARAASIEVMPDRTDDQLSRAGAFTVSQRVIAGRPGGPDISVVLCRPRAARTPTPAFLYTHGGGLVMGSARIINDELLDWAREFGAAIVSVDYHLAPESPHPGPVEECYAALVWLAANADELGIDAGRLIVAGESAGGGLAAATALLARDRGGPPLLAQVLRCPMLDDRNDTPSAIQGEGRGVWDRRANIAGWTALLGEARGGPDVPVYAAPARATDLAGLPPALIDVGAAETFRDEAVAYASSIWRCGGQAELHVYSGAFHAYDAMAPHAAVSKDTKEMRCRWLRRILHPVAPARA